ncbi:PEP-CTERM putative exosortase interaction domain-containing protein [Opitutaceae bacterium TAV1]|nr:PEP-CTERM putative exosortase interaction domain-containing protein [Opitutaceae bacterium TAV1]
MNIKSSPGHSVRPVANIGALALLIAAFTAAPLLAADPQTLVASQDNFVKDGSAASTVQGSPKGGGTTLEVAMRGTNNNRKIYLGFDLTGIASSVVFDSVGTSLSLSFTDSPIAGDAISGKEDVILDVYGIASAVPLFDETTITYANAPENKTGANDPGFLTTNTTLLGSITIDSSNSALAGTSVTLSSPQLVAFLNQSIGKSVTIMIGNRTITSPYQPLFRFHSSEAEVADTLKPHLALAVGSTVPEPSVLAALLGGLAFALAAFIRRR